MLNPASGFAETDPETVPSLFVTGAPPAFQHAAVKSLPLLLTPVILPEAVVKPSGSKLSNKYELPAERELLLRIRPPVGPLLMSCH